LSVCAVHGIRVAKLEVEYIGRKAYGATLQVVEVGWYSTWPKPLAGPAVHRPGPVRGEVVQGHLESGGRV
jgi:hypothetical protein